MGISDKELPFLDILIKRNDDKIRMDIFLSQQTLAVISSSPPAIRTIVRKTYHLHITEKMYHSGKSTTEIRTSVRIKEKPKKV